MRKTSQTGQKLKRLTPLGAGRSGAIRPSGWSESLQWVERIAPGGGAIRPTPHGFNGREEVSRTNEKSSPRPKYLVIRFFQKNCCDWHGTCMFFVESNLDSLLAEVTFLKTALSRCRLFKEMFS
jgi:hypothetical protein